MAEPSLVVADVMALRQRQLAANVRQDRVSEILKEAIEPRDVITMDEQVRVPAFARPRLCVHRVRERKSFQDDQREFRVPGAIEHAHRLGVTQRRGSQLGGGPLAQLRPRGSGRDACQRSPREQQSGNTVARRRLADGAYRFFRKGRQPCRVAEQRRELAPGIRWTGGTQVQR